MKSLRILLPTAAALLLATPAATAADWTDLFVGYRYCFHVIDPSIDLDII